MTHAITLTDVQANSLAESIADLINEQRAYLDYEDIDTNYGYGEEWPLAVDMKVSQFQTMAEICQMIGAEVTADAALDMIGTLKATLEDV